MKLNKDRSAGCFLGLAVGDALGTTNEFKSRGSFKKVETIVGMGPFGLRKGDYTDDTAMARCLAESLIVNGGRVNQKDQMDRYCAWAADGYMSSNGRCFDIGITIRGALSRYATDGNPVAGPTGTMDAGNGSLMRLAPVIIAFQSASPEAFYSAIEESSVTTHGAAEAIDACKVYGAGVRSALEGNPKEWIYRDMLAACSALSINGKIRAMMTEPIAHVHEKKIDSSGYVIASMRAALWCFITTETFRDCVVKAANLGGDADTVAAIAGMLAGAFYGKSGIPTEWLEYPEGYKAQDFEIDDGDDDGLGGDSARVIESKINGAPPVLRESKEIEAQALKLVEIAELNSK